ncbi:DUF2892 domain-containing protein [uncultured Tenacibaculum sp.]|uniref:YgaP family membrane protein n=2 Tax=uncultured Tenacibaculum sp. TaxID=174713 RepID=UPI00262378A1|nr:DUF2892 domain-containing protein [uncultured Tenacibaculum sp.]
MKKNMSGFDRIFRIAIAVVVGVLYSQGIITGILSYILITVAFVFLLTSFVSFCPLYRLIGISTCKIKN